MGKLGYNILADGYAVNLVDDIKAANADYHLIMTVPQRGIDGSQDLETLDWWADKLAPAKIVRRTYNNLEGNWSVYPTNADIVKRWKAQNRLQYIHDDPVNEPSLWRDVTINKRYVARTVDLLDRAADAGITVAAGAFSVGLPFEGYIKEGIYDEFIRAVNRGGHYISAHLYGTGNQEGEVLGYSNLLQQIVGFKWPFSPQDWYWLLRRPDYFAHRAVEIGEAVPNVLATESFIDLIPDALVVLNAIGKSLKDVRFNNDLRGFEAYERLLTSVYPSRDLADIIGYLAENFIENIIWPDFYKGAMLFAVNPNWETPQGSNYGIAKMAKFRQIHVPRINKRKVIVPNMTEGTLVILSDNTRFRAMPENGVKGAILGVLPAGSYECLRSEEILKGSGEDWHFYEGFGYIADSVIEWIPNPDKISFHFGHATREYTRAEADAVQDAFRLVADELKFMIDKP